MIVALSQFKQLAKNQTIIFLHDRHDNHGFLPPCQEQIILLSQMLTQLASHDKETVFYIEVQSDFKDWIVKNRAHLVVSATWVPILKAIDTEMQDQAVRFINFDSRGSIDWAIITINSLYAQLQQQAKVNRWSLNRFISTVHTISQLVDAYCFRAKSNNEWLPVMYEATVGNYLQLLEQRLNVVSQIVSTLAVSDAIKQKAASRYTEINAIVYAQLKKLLDAHAITESTHLLHACAALEEKSKVSNPAAQFLAEGAAFVDIELLAHILNSDAKQIVVHGGFSHIGFMYALLEELPEYQNQTAYDCYLKQGYFAYVASKLLPGCLQRLFGWSKPHCGKRADQINLSDICTLPLTVETLKKALRFE